MSSGPFCKLHSSSMSNNLKLSNDIRESASDHSNLVNVIGFVVNARGKGGRLLCAPPKKGCAEWKKLKKAKKKTKRLAEEVEGLSERKVRKLLENESQKIVDRKIQKSKEIENGGNVWDRGEQTRKNDSLHETGEINCNYIAQQQHETGGKEKLKNTNRTKRQKREKCPHEEERGKKRKRIKNHSLIPLDNLQEIESHVNKNFEEENNSQINKSSPVNKKTVFRESSDGRFQCQDDQVLQAIGTNDGLESSRKRFRKKSSKNESPTDLQIIKDIESMAALLRNEIQRPYNPREGHHLVDPKCRNIRDHLGREIKQGPFTNEENEILRNKILEYFNAQGWTEPEGWSNLHPHPNARGAQRQLSSRHWGVISTCLPQRSVAAIRHHAQRTMLPWKMGPWSQEEEVDLVNLVKQNGYKWGLFSHEHFHRPPHLIQLKWKELEPFVTHSEGNLPVKRQRASFNQRDDVKLLTAIRLITGVPLPFRSIPWSEVQRQLPLFSKSQLAQRYKFVLFPSILGTHYKGATQMVVLRQFLRYLRRGIEAGVIGDISEVELRRVVPFWYSADHARRLTKYIKVRCPAEVQKASLREQVEYMYKLLGCDKKEESDLRRLAKSFKTLQEINGVAMISQKRGVLSQRYQQAPTIAEEDEQLLDRERVHDKKRAEVFESRLFKYSRIPEISDLGENGTILGPVAATLQNIDLESNEYGNTGNDYGTNTSVISDQTRESYESNTDESELHTIMEDEAHHQDNHTSTEPLPEMSIAKTKQWKKKKTNIFRPPALKSFLSKESRMKILRPMTASADRIRGVVPPDFQEVPEAFPIYLASHRLRSEKQKEHKEFILRDSKACESAEKGSQSYLDYHLYDALGLLDYNNQSERQQRSKKRKTSDNENNVGERRGTNTIDKEKKSRRCSRSSDIDEAERNNTVPESSDFLQFVNQIDSLAAEAPDTCSTDDEEGIMGSKKKKKKNYKASKCVIIHGERIIRKHHPWMS